MADGNTIGELQYLIGADASRLEASIEAADKKLDALGKTVDGSVGKVDESVDRANMKMEILGEKADEAGDQIERSIGQAERSVEGIGDAADNAGEKAQAAGRKAEAAAQGAGDAADAAGRRIKDSADASTGSFERLGAAASKFQSVVGKIAIPLAIAATLTQIVNLLRRASKEAEALAARMDQFGDSAEDALNREIIAARSVNDLTTLKLELNRQVIESQKAVTDEIERQFQAQDKLALIDDTGILGVLDTWARILGIRTNLERMTREAVKDAERENEILRQRLGIIDGEIKKREEAAQAAADLAEEQQRAQREADVALSRDRAKAIKDLADLERKEQGSLQEQREAAIERLRTLLMEAREAATKAEREAIEELIDVRIAAINREFDERERREKEAERAAAEAARKAHEAEIARIKAEKEAELAAIRDIAIAQQQAFGIQGSATVGASGLSTLLGAFASEARSGDGIIVGALP